MPLPNKLTLPSSLLTGTYVLASSGPEVFSAEIHWTPNVLVAQNDQVSVLPKAEASVEAALQGITAPEPTTMGITIFWLADGRQVFVCTEIAENAGRSVTNAWPQLAECVLKAAGEVSPDKAVFVEHYFKGSYREGMCLDTFDLVTIKWENSRAVDQGWTHLATEGGRS